MQGQDKQIITPYTFLQTGLQPYLCKLLSHNSYNRPTPIQYHSITNAINHPESSLICRAKSGTGKTLAYIGIMLYRLCCVKELENKTYCVVVSPTRELAVQIYQTLKLLLDSATNIKAGTEQQKHTKQLLLNLTPMLTIGGLSFEDDRKKYRQHACHILICTVGRLWQLFRNNIIILNKDLTIIYDQGDKLFNNIDDKFIKVLKFVERGRWFVFSATYDTKVMLSLFNMKFKKWLYVQTGLKAGQLEVVITDQLQSRLLDEQKQQASLQNVMKNGKEGSLLQNQENLTLENIKKFQIVIPDNAEQSYLDQKLTVLSQLLQNLHYQKCLIFIQKKSFLEQISQYLSSSSFEHILIHGSLTQAARFRMMNRINSTKIILASDLLARGIDIKLDLVILFDVRQCDTFWHRIGRTGRYGRTGVAVSLEKVQNGQNNWLNYDQQEVNRILDGIDEYQKKQWYGGHMTQIGKWQDYDLNKQQQNNYKYFEQQNYQQTIKQISEIQQKKKHTLLHTVKQQSGISVSLNQISMGEPSKLDKMFSEISSKSELKEFIKQRVLKCSKCLALIQGTTQLTGYQFEILKYIQQ